MRLLSILRNLQSFLDQTHKALKRRTLFQLSAAALLSIVLPNRVDAEPIRPRATDLPTAIPPIQPLLNLLNFPDTLTLSTREMLKRDRTRLLLFFKDAIQEEDAFVSELMSAGFLIEPSSQPIRVNYTPTRVFVRSISGKAINQDLVNQFANLQQKKLRRIGPIYLMPGGTGPRNLYCALPHVLIVRPKKGIADEQLSKSLAFFQLQELPEISKYMAGYRYFVLDDLAPEGIFTIYKRLVTHEKNLVDRVLLDFMPLIVPTGAAPTDPYYSANSPNAGDPGQWNLRQIDAEAAWVIATGSNVRVAVIDSGCDLQHPDLGTPTGATFNYPDSALPPSQRPSIPVLGSTGGVSSFDNPHGTQVAGVVASRFNNINPTTNTAEGIAGLAPTCTLLSLRLWNWSRSEMVAAITYASDGNFGNAKVINLSLGERPEDVTGDWRNFIDPILDEVFLSKKVLICSITQNYDESTVYYPGEHRYVMACGASNGGGMNGSNFRCEQADWSACSWEGSNWGPGISVVAPGSNITTTSIRGRGNLGATTSQANDGYDENLCGTSLAAPHISGLAALLISAYPSLQNDPAQIRNIIERTADKVHRNAPNGYVYTVMPDIYADGTLRYPNGAWNDQVGYGRINAHHALDFADVFIKDSIDDVGNEPSTGVFYETSDIVVRPSDDNEFVPEDFLKSSILTPDSDNVLYVRVTNNGPAVARDVSVEVRMVGFAGTEFVYTDWLADDNTHITLSPLMPGTATFTSIPPGAAGAVIAKFKITVAQVNTLLSFTEHPCFLASVVCANDYAFANAEPVAGGITVTNLNNLAQRNVSIMQVRSGKPVSFDFIVGNIHKMNLIAEILVERGWLPDITLPPSHPPKGPLPLPRTLLALDDAYEKFPHTDIKGRAGDVHIVGGEIARVDIDDKPLGTVHSEKRRFVEIGETTIARLERSPGKLLPLSLQTVIPEDAKKGSRYRLRVSQKNEKGEVIGGASIIYVVQ